MKNASPKTPFAKKSFGQNFLVDASIIQKIIGALNLGSDDTVIEIGPGRGALTEEPVKRAGRVIAVEFELGMIDILREKFARIDNFELIEQDALKVNFAELADSAMSEHKPVKLVANLPYYISTAILQKLIEQSTVFDTMVLMFQREVVERITAEPGSSERGFLTVLVEAYLETERLFDVPPGAFRPSPKVWSSVVRLTPRSEPLFELEGLPFFRELVSAAFRQKRKTLVNNLKAWPELKRLAADPENLLVKSGIDPKRRAETLSIDEWKNLHTNIQQL